MAWQGDAAKVQQLCQMFEAAASPDMQIQQQVMQALNQFSQLPDFNMYLVSIFAQMPTQPEGVRQRAGLLLKQNIKTAQAGGLVQGVIDHINAQVVVAMKDTSRAIRHTAGTIITTMVQKLGLQACGTTLERLVGCLGEQSHEVIEGALSALGKVCEDGVAVFSTAKKLTERGKTPTPKVAQEASLFIQWTSQQVVPRILEVASPTAPAFARQCALECLNHFALGGVLSEDTPPFQQYCIRYLETLGQLANGTEPEVLGGVCKGFACIVEGGWKCLTEHHYTIILGFMLKASQNPEYGVRYEALAVWGACAKSPDTWGIVRKLMPELVPVLLANMVYSDADYLCLDPSQMENSNANVADRPEDLKPRFQKEKDNIDGEAPDEDDDEPQSTQAPADQWTARKAAASSLDHLSGVLKEDMLPLVLPEIQKKLNDPRWDHQEAGVLALGAIGINCMDKLVDFLPAVLELLLKLCQAEKPLLRSISCWTTSRYAGWVCHQNNANREQYLTEVLKVILQRSLDGNKRVQEAAISAVLTYEEVAGKLIVPHLPSVVETLVKAFQLYQIKNMRILYDAVSTLPWAVGQELDKPMYTEALLTPLLQKFETVADNDHLTLPLFECLTQMLRLLAKSNDLKAIVGKLIMRCIRIVNDTARAAQMWEQNPNEFERPDSDLMGASCDLLSGVVEGFQGQSREIIAQMNFLSMVLPLALRDKVPRVKQAGFWLMGVTCTHCIDPLLPMLPNLMPLAIAGLSPQNTLTVNNNAVWAIGECCAMAPKGTMTQYLDPIVTQLVEILKRSGANIPYWQWQGYHELMQNTCLCVMQFRCKTELGEKWPAIFAQFPAQLQSTLTTRYCLPT